MKRINQILIWLVGGLLIFNLILLISFWFLEKGNQSDNFAKKEILTNLFPDKERGLKIIFLNVGQGDAILIQTPTKKNILIDGGPDKRIIYKLDRYLPFYARQIDLMILTHPDTDHLNGLVEVLKRYKVEMVFYNGVKDEEPAYAEFLKEIERRKIKKETVWQGKLVEFFISENEKKNGVIEILFPFENLTDQSFREDNEFSIVLKLTFGKIKFLLTGDATKKVEKQLIERGLDLTAEVLKVSHHGAKDATSLEFLEKVQPVYAVISVGQNKFSHPSLRVLRNLKKIRAQILRTDQLGDIGFKTDGVNLYYLNEK